MTKQRKKLVFSIMRSMTKWRLELCHNKKGIQNMFVLLTPRSSSMNENKNPGKKNHRKEFIFIHSLCSLKNVTTEKKLLVKMMM